MIQENFLSKTKANGRAGDGAQGPRIAISTENFPDLSNVLNNRILFFEQWFIDLQVIIKILSKIVRNFGPVFNLTIKNQ